MYRHLKSALVLASLALLFVAANAAQRQCVIVDGFTQWNCGPCASWNPTERTILENMTRDTVISIKTHGWWPGANNDAFHLYNVSETTARINYYGCNWVPWVMCDGSINISNVNATALTNGIRNRMNTPSPCTIDDLLAITTSPTGIQVNGTVNAESNVVANLYCALIRNEVTYTTSPGSNGETSFPDVFCDAAPNFNVGTAINVPAGTSYDFSVNLVRDEEWDVENLTVVVFIQNNSTKDILQGTWANVSQEYAFYTENDDPVQQIVQTNSGETAYLIELNNIGTMNDTYTVTLDGNWPAGWAYSVEQDGHTGDPNSIEVEVASMSSEFLVIRVNPNNYPGSVAFNLHTESQANSLISTEHDWRLMAGLDVLVIDADGGETFETYYADALTDANMPVVWGWWDTALDEADPALFEGVDALVWFTGNLWQETLTPLDQLNLQDYLDMGGNLFMTGQGMGFDMRNDQFFSDYVHAHYNLNFSIGASVTGLAGTPAEGLAFSVVGGDGANNQNRQSSISALEGANLLFNYDQEYQGNTQGAGVTVDNGTYKLVYLGFGFEAISTAEDRAAMMTHAVSWLLGITATPEAPVAAPAEFSLMQNYPNPFNPETNIPFALPVRSNVTLKVYDLLGREVATLANGAFEAGVHTVNLNGSDLSSGVYFYTIKADGGSESFTSTRKLVLMK